jgi:hypothetical protein
MAIKSLDPRKQLAVVATRDQDLVRVSNSRLEDGERTAGKFVLLKSCDFVLTKSFVSFADGIRRRSRGGRGLVKRSALGKLKVGGTHVRSLRGFARSSLRCISRLCMKAWGIYILYLCVSHDGDLKKLGSEL